MKNAAPASGKWLISAPVFLLALLFGASAAWAIVVADISLDGTDRDSSLATAGGDFASGWQWTADFTVPDAETIFSMKFADFDNGSETIPAAGNVRIYSSQSSDHGDESSAVTIQGNDWSDTMTLTGDKDEETAGRQISVVVQVRVPEDAQGADFASDFEARSELPPDTTAPVITLNGTDPDTAFFGIPYSDPGATATDDVDGDISSSIVVGGTVDMNTPGDHELTYNVSDAAGNAATEVIRTVTVLLAPIPK
ncbi:MAG: DUF5011 domain-containing protein [Patescibacteria group bacterium]|nr:DUF5011 domain-containing protein [Patescibacteria group bacterium]